MIYPKTPQTAGAVAAHYDELDPFYRDIWGHHLHHGYFRTGREPSAVATAALIDLLADHLDLVAGASVVDIGCGYGATAVALAGGRGVSVTGFTLSAAQAAHATPHPKVVIKVADWLANRLPSASFDRGYAIESSEHMEDKAGFFEQAYRVLKPGGRLAIYAWLAADQPTPRQINHLLEPICREGRLPSMGTLGDYRALASAAGFAPGLVLDISGQVSRTWWLCARRFIGRLSTRPRYLAYLLDRRRPNRVFALTVFRLLAAYRTGAMRYCLLIYDKPAADDPEGNRHPGPGTPG